MSLIDVTAESLTKAIGVEVPDTYVLLAKYVVLELGNEEAATMMGVESSMIAEAREDEIFKAILPIVAHAHSGQVLATDSYWDTIEHTALENLHRVAARETDVETNLKIAAIANKAQRRSGKRAREPLNPSIGAGMATLELGERFIERIQDGGQTVERGVERFARLTNGEVKTPQFAKIQDAVAERIRVPEDVSDSTKENRSRLADRNTPVELPRREVEKSTLTKDSMLAELRRRTQSKAA